jgi:hypothetical protein
MYLGYDFFQKLEFRLVGTVLIVKTVEQLRISNFTGTIFGVAVSVISRRDFSTFIGT